MRIVNSFRKVPKDFCLGSGVICVWVAAPIVFFMSLANFIAIQVQAPRGVHTSA